jgi:trigger factor
VEVPESLIAREQRNLELEAAAALESLGMSREAALARARQDQDDLKAKAEKRARSALIVDAIAAQENVEVSEDQVADRVAALVTQSSGHQRERLADFYSHQENRDALAQVMRREMTLDRLLSRAQAVDDAETSSGEPETGTSAPVDEVSGSKTEE